jgi:hypothetical protein
VARTAVVAGTASAVAGRVQRRQASRFAEKDAHTAAQQQAAYDQEVGYQQQPPPAPAPPPAAPASTADDRIVQLERLGGLYSQGVLTAEEFAAEKARVLGT